MQGSAAVRPDSYSFPFVLKAVVRLSSLQAGLQVHCQSLTGALASDVRVAAALVEMYSKLGFASDARKVFDETPFRDILLWNAIGRGPYSVWGHRRCVPRVCGVG